MVTPTSEEIIRFENPHQKNPLTYFKINLWKNKLTFTELSKEDTRLLLKAFFSEKGIVRQHLDSYNEFINHDLQEAEDKVGEILSKFLKAYIR